MFSYNRVVLFARGAVLAVPFVLAGCDQSDSKQSTPKNDVAAYGAPASGQTAPEQTGPASLGSGDAAAPALGSKTLDNPDNLQMTMLALRLTSQPPPFEDWADQADTVRMADEFSKANKRSAEIARLKAIYAGTAGVGHIVIKVASNFSQYDPDRSGYYLTAFSPGSNFTFQARMQNQQPVELTLDNALAAQFWPMKPDAAKALLDKLHGARNVSVLTSIAITGAEQRASGTQLHGRITHYTIFADTYANHEQLADFSVK